MPKFKPARLVPKLFEGVPFSGANYDLSTFSANTIAPFELGLNSSAETIVVNFGGRVLSFAPTGGTTYISAVTSDQYVFRSGDTMSGPLTMSAGTFMRWNNASGATGVLLASAHTSNHTWGLPNSSGTIALTPKCTGITHTTVFIGQSHQVYFVDTTGGVSKPTLPAGPSLGDTYWFYDARSNFGTNHMEITGNGNNVNGVPKLIVSGANKHVQVIYNGSQWSAFISA